MKKRFTYLTLFLAITFICASSSPRTNETELVSTSTVGLYDTQIDFIEHPEQSFGFDKVEGSNDVYISLAKQESVEGVKKVYTTKVNVEIFPFVEVGAYYVTSNNPGIFTVNPNANDGNAADGKVNTTAEITEIELTGGDFPEIHKSALLQVHCKSLGGQVVKELHVEVYKKRNLNISVFRIKDPRNPSTTPRFPLHFDDLKTRLNKIYKQGVIEVLSVNGNANMDIEYDINENGYLDYYYEGVNPEFNLIKNNPQVSGSPRVAYIGNQGIRDNWRLAKSTKKGETTLTLESIKNIQTGSELAISTEKFNDYEDVIVQSIDLATKTITLKTALEFDHEMATHSVFIIIAGSSTENIRLVTSSKRSSISLPALGNNVMSLVS